MAIRTCLFAILAIALLPSAKAQTASCDSATAPVLTAELPARPFAAVASADGCIVYVSLVEKGEESPGAIAVLKRSGGMLSALRGVSVDPAPFGLVLSHDGTLLIAHMAAAPLSSIPQSSWRANRARRSRGSTMADATGFPTSRPTTVLRSSATSTPPTFR